MISYSLLYANPQGWNRYATHSVSKASMKDAHTFIIKIIIILLSYMDSSIVVYSLDPMHDDTT